MRAGALPLIISPKEKILSVYIDIIGTFGGEQ